nr:hypothetical protein [Tanacetum cinerariifolium]
MVDELMVIPAVEEVAEPVAEADEEYMDAFVMDMRRTWLYCLVRMMTSRMMTLRMITLRVLTRMRFGRVRTWAADEESDIGE